MMTLFEKAINSDELLEFAFGKEGYYLADREYGEHSVLFSWTREIAPLFDTRDSAFVQESIVRMFEAIVTNDQFDSELTGHTLLYHLHVLYYLVEEGRVSKIDLTELDHAISLRLRSYLDDPNSVEKRKIILNSIARIKDNGGLLSFNVTDDGSTRITEENSVEAVSNKIEFSTKLDSDQNYIDEFEEKFAITIPDSYKSFLLKFGGGVPMKNHYIKEVETSEVFDFEISAFYGKGIDETTFDLGFSYVMTLGIIPRGLLPIADDGIGNYICVGHQNEYLNKIYIVWDTETDKLTDINELEDSLDHFIGRLK